MRVVVASRSCDTLRCALAKLGPVNAGAATPCSLSPWQATHWAAYTVWPRSTCACKYGALPTPTIFAAVGDGGMAASGSSMPVMRVVRDLVVGEWDMGTPSR